MQWTRRAALKTIGLAGGACLFQPAALLADNRAAARQFHVCLSTEAIQRDPELLPAVRRAGVGAVWLAGFCYGHWPYDIPSLRVARALVERQGMAARVINLPLGHPGDALGASDGQFPLTPPRHWHLGWRADGSRYAGTSLHEPATAENVKAVQGLRRAGFRGIFLDDDFRLARGPGEIGGCFCAEHRSRFLQSHGYGNGQWQALLQQVRQREFTPLLRAWVDFTGEELSAAFRAQRQAAGNGNLGIMAMYLGAEKAGIRLEEYADDPFRVGEMMFDDASFGPVKNKMDELFSGLMHRRFCRPELAFSETTAYPADRLSARNLAAKLVFSTIADVRHTMFMSGLTPFPRAHWDTLGPAMRAQAALHRALAGHRLAGPLKHYWGEASRYAGDDQPFSLFLASGIPFEVTDAPARDGWTFLSDADARQVAAGRLESRGARFLCRAGGAPRPDKMRALEESLPAIMAFKAALTPQLKRVPYVAQSDPAVCAWYPGARAVLLWNPKAEKSHFTLRLGKRSLEFPMEALEAKLVTGI